MTLKSEAELKFQPYMEEGETKEREVILLLLVTNQESWFKSHNKTTVSKWDVCGGSHWPDTNFI